MARKKKETPPPLRLRGMPASLTGVVPERQDGEKEVVVCYEPPGADGLVEASLMGDPDPRVVRVCLPDHVEPGTYRGTLEMDGEEREVELEVEPSPNLRVIPEQLRIEARPGETVEAALTVLNRGNVPVRIRRVQAFGIFMAGGVERALHQAYVSTLDEGTRRLDVLAENLARAHGGLVKMRVREGHGELATGDARSLVLEVELPADLQGGRVYGGNWELANLVYPVTIHVLDGEDADDEDEA